MSYLTFNKWVFDYYQTTIAHDGVCCLAIDEYEIENFKNQYSLDSLKFNEVLYSPWSNLISVQNYGETVIPMYFGLIALQCAAAASMETFGEIASSNFNTRFCKITGIDSSKLAAKYSEEWRGEPIQDYLWNKMKLFLRDYFGFQLNIPAKTTGPGRYIQYPKSQAVLNKEDLKEIGRKIFSSIEEDVEPTSEHRFYKLFLKKFSDHRFHRRNNQVKYEGFFKEIFLKQIFNYYNSRDWQRIVFSGNVRSNPNKKARIIIELDLEDHPHFYQGTKEILYPNKVLNREDIYIFQKLAGTNEYEQSSSFHLNKELLIVSASFLDFGENVVHAFCGLYIVQCLFVEIKDIPNQLLPRFKANSDVPVTLKGLRIGYSYQYLEGLGPEIIGKKYSILFATYDNPLELAYLENYSSSTCKPGIYVIRVPGFTNLEFRVLEPKAALVESQMKEGLDLQSFLTSKEGMLLKGLRLSGTLGLSNTKITVNEWIKANVKGDVLSENKILKSIKNTKL